MDKLILDKINHDFRDEERKLVIDELSSIGLHHVWESDNILESTQLSILKLAKGELKNVVELTKNAKNDFRDVIMWADEVK